MKKIVLPSLLMSALLFLFNSSVHAECGKGHGKGAKGGGGGGAGRNADAVSATNEAPATLTDAEKAGLLLMREEEKLARDVYTTLGEKWDSRVFNNIKQSEQRHMDAVGVLLERYRLADPAKGKEPGQFTNPAIQKLYGQLVAKGERSLSEAMAVGAEIEDLDIADLDKLMAATKNPAIIAVYENLLRGSRNHLRAFSRNLKALGETYEAQHLTQERFDAIAAGEQERGRNGGGARHRRRGQPAR